MLELGRSYSVGGFNRRAFKCWTFRRRAFKRWAVVASVLLYPMQITGTQPDLSRRHRRRRRSCRSYFGARTQSARISRSIGAYRAQRHRGYTQSKSRELHRSTRCDSTRRCSCRTEGSWRSVPFRTDWNELDSLSQYVASTSEPRLRFTSLATGYDTITFSTYPSTAFPSLRSP